jgi:hypothetical protein
MLVLLSGSNLYIVSLRASAFVITRSIATTALALSAGLFWEYITPLYRNSTGDPLDLVAYVFGALLYCLSIHSKSRVA